MANAGYIAAQPLDFSDFSGGLTDNFLQGDVKQYAKADNFLLTVDRKLESRFGTQIYDPVGYRLGSSTSRVAGLFTGINESILFAHANRDIYVQSPDASSGTAWSRILGPAGSEPIAGGSVYAQLTNGEFQRQTYFVTNAGVAPGKIFRDQNNQWKALTAGLPKMIWSPNFPTDSSLIAACITLANALRASFIAHIADQANIGSGTSDVFQHKLFDKWSANYLTPQAWFVFDPEFPGPIPPPTPAPDATDTASLYTLCTALALAYEHHREDLAGNRIYHQDIFFQPLSGGGGFNPSNIGINQRLVLSGVVTTPAQAAAFLDELVQKWNWHQQAPLAHSPSNNFAQISRYLIPFTSKIGTIYTSNQTIQATPNYVDFLSFAYWIKQAWNAHTSGSDATGGNMHAQVDLYGPITLPDPVDFDSAALIIFWARWLYGQVHQPDADTLTHTQITFSSSSGSANITSVVNQSTGAPITLPVDSWIWVLSSYFSDDNPHNQSASRVLTSASGIATLSRPVITGASGTVGQTSSSWLHGDFVTGGFAPDTTTQETDAAEKISNFGDVGTTLDTWIVLGTEFLNALGAHEASGITHKNSNMVGSDFMINGGVAPNGNPFFIPQVVSYAYAAFYRYQYTVEPNGLLYLNQGPPVFSLSLQTLPSFPVGTIITSPNTAYFSDALLVKSNPSVTLTGIPPLVNTTLTNYDTTISVAPQTQDSGLASFYQNFTLDLYRTTDGGTTFFFLDQLTNSQGTLTQSYTDLTNENFPLPGTTALNFRPVIYTSGGVLANDPPPVSKYILALNGFMYYGAIIDTGQFFPQRIRQSIAGAPDSAPATFFDDLEDELVGMSSARSNLIAVCRNSVYRVSGSFTSTGQGFMNHERISDTLGGLNSKSIVRTEIGVFFAGQDGFYYTDGYQVIKISIELDATYRAMTASDTQKARIYGCYDKLTRRVWWSMQSQGTAQDNDILFVYYLDYGVKPAGVFTKALTTQSWQPSSLVFYKGRMIVGDSHGYLFKSDPDTKTDPKINTATLPSTWTTCYIPWDFRTCALDFGTTYMRKWITKIHSIGQNVGNAALQVISINDNNDTSQSSGIQNLPPIQYLGNPMWGDATVVWGTSGYAWKYDGKMDLWRRFPARSMRSDFKQVAYTPGSFVVYKSDNYPLFSFATVDATAKTATVQTPSGFTSITWPLDVMDLFIAFSTDAYAQTYLITALDSTHKIITYSDATNLSANNSAAAWQISGIKKEQRIRITNFQIHFGSLGDENQDYMGNSLPGGLGANS